MATSKTKVVDIITFKLHKFLGLWFVDRNVFPNEIALWELPIIDAILTKMIIETSLVMKQVTNQMDKFRKLDENHTI
jgi:hypothetical protein